MGQRHYTCVIGFCCAAQPCTLFINPIIFVLLPLTTSHLSIMSYPGVRIVYSFSTINRAFIHVLSCSMEEVMALPPDLADLADPAGSVNHMVPRPTLIPSKYYLHIYITG